MLAIRLKSIGKKHQRSFRLVVQESRSKLLGKFIDDLGWYNPHTNKYEVNKEKVGHWISVGAKPSMTAAQILKKSGVELPAGIKTWKTVNSKKKKQVEEKAPAAPAAEASAQEEAPAAEAAPAEEATPAEQAA